MANLISNCPKCGTTNVVNSSPYMRLDRGTGVTCKNCSLRFCATLSKKDILALFKDSSVSPVIKGTEDYMLDSTYYLNP